jgi:Parkin co-regulated protein
MSTRLEVFHAGSIMERLTTGFIGTNRPKVNFLHLTSVELDYDPLLINCFEGLLETDHPYSFVANRAL